MINVDFKQLELELIRYIEDIHTDDKFPYPLQDGCRGSFFGTCFVALIAEMLRYELKNREAVIDALMECLDHQSGIFINPDVSQEIYTQDMDHDAEYLALQSTYFARNALHALGVEQLPPVKFAVDLAESGGIYEWLSQLNWKNPWLVTNLDMFLGAFLVEWKKEHPDNTIIDDALGVYFRWHNEHQSPDDGFWGASTDPLNRMAGGYHIYLIYEALSLPIPRLTEAAEATLKLAWHDSLYVYGGGGGSCEDMDAIDILVREYLRDSPLSIQIVESLKRSADVLASGQNSDGGYSWRINPRLSKVFSLLAKGRANESIGAMKAIAYGLLNPSHYNSTHLYSSRTVYPYQINKSDTWSSWFRPLTLAMVAQAMPDAFRNSCDWYVHSRPGLGINPLNICSRESDN